MHGDYNIHHQDVNSAHELLEQRMAALQYAKKCLFAFTAIKVAQFLLHYKTGVVVAKESFQGRALDMHLLMPAYKPYKRKVSL